MPIDLQYVPFEIATTSGTSFVCDAGTTDPASLSGTLILLQDVWIKPPVFARNLAVPVRPLRGVPIIEYASPTDPVAGPDWAAGE